MFRPLDEALIIHRQFKSYVPLFFDSLELLYSLVSIVNVVDHNMASAWSQSLHETNIS
jgi:hypothetical protein